MRTITQRIDRGLEQAGLTTRDMGLLISPSTRARREAPIGTLPGHSSTYGIATEQFAMTAGRAPPLYAYDTL